MNSVPAECVLVGVRPASVDARILSLKLADSSELDFLPGQFVELALPGLGSMPVSICSSPTDRAPLEVCLLNSGKLASAIRALHVGDALSIRAPLGNGFPLDHLRGQHLLFIAPTPGLATLRSLIRYVFAMREDFGNLAILVGAPAPDAILFADELDSWARAPRADVLVAVEAPRAGWTGPTGPVTTLLDQIADRVPSSVALVSGAPREVHSLCLALLDRGTNPENIYVALVGRPTVDVRSSPRGGALGKQVWPDGPVVCYYDVENVDIASL